MDMALAIAIMLSPPGSRATPWLATTLISTASPRSLLQRGILPLGETLAIARGFWRAWVPRAVRVSDAWRGSLESVEEAVASI